VRVGDVIGNPVKRAAAAQIVSDLWNHWRANLCSECIVIVSEVLLARLCKLLIQPASNYDCQCHTCRSQATLSSSSKPVGQGMASVFHSGLKSGVTVCLKWKVRCSVSAQLHTRGSGFDPPPSVAVPVLRALATKRVAGSHVITVLPRSSMYGVSEAPSLPPGKLVELGQLFHGWLHKFLVLTP